MYAKVGMVGAASMLMVVVLVSDPQPATLNTFCSIYVPAPLALKLMIPWVRLLNTSPEPVLDNMVMIPSPAFAPSVGVAVPLLLQ